MVVYMPKAGWHSMRPYWQMTGTLERTRIAYCVRTGTSGVLPSPRLP